jgi:hypothetical protein
MVELMPMSGHVPSASVASGVAHTVYVCMCLAWTPAGLLSHLLPVCLSKLCQRIWCVLQAHRLQCCPAELPAEQPRLWRSLWGANFVT